MKYILGVLSVLILVVVIAGAAFYFGQRSTNQSKEMTTTPTPTAFVTQEVLEETPVTENKVTVEAGGVLVFNAYTLQIPDDWAQGREKDQDLDRLTISNGSYNIKIFQAATGGAPCLYPGDADVEGPSSRFISFVEFNGASNNQFRRGTTGPQNSMTVCEMQSGNWGQPTSFGHISYQMPANPDENMIKIMDTIISSIKKK